MRATVGADHADLAGDMASYSNPVPKTLKYPV